MKKSLPLLLILAMAILFAQPCASQQQPIPPGYAGPPPPEENPSGQWVEVPGTWVNGTWVPPHRAWVPANAAPPGPPLGDAQYAQPPGPPPGGAEYGQPSGPPPGGAEYGMPPGPPPAGAEYAPPPAYAFPAPPEVVPVPGTYAYMVPGINVDIFFYQGYWYRPFRGRWFMATAYNGPWVFTRAVPPVLLRLPPGYRRLALRYRPIPHAELMRSWRGWERERHWEHQHGEHEHH